MADDEAIERVAAPGERSGRCDHPSEVEVTDLEPNPSPQFLDDGIRSDRQASDLAKKLDLENRHRRNEERLAIDRSARLCAQHLSGSGIEPGDHVRIEIDQGFHSEDQSRCTRSSGLPTMLPGTRFETVELAPRGLVR